MIIRNISKQNLIEIMVLPLIFGIIFGLGLLLLVLLGLKNYVVYTAWCLISGILVLLIIVGYTYRSISTSPKLAIHDPRLYAYFYQKYQPQKNEKQLHPYGRPLKNEQTISNMPVKNKIKPGNQKTSKISDMKSKK